MRNNWAAGQHDINIIEAIKLMQEKHLHNLIVMNKDEPIGIVTERDLVRKVLGENKDPTKLQIHEVMSSPLITISPEEDIQEAAKIMVEKDIRRLPVIERNKLVGLVTVSDITKYIAERRSLWDKLFSSMGRYTYPPY